MNKLSKILDRYEKFNCFGLIRQDGKWKLVYIQRDYDDDVLFESSLIEDIEINSIFAIQKKLNQLKYKKIKSDKFWRESLDKGWFCTDFLVHPINKASGIK